MSNGIAGKLSLSLVMGLVVLSTACGDPEGGAPDCTGTGDCSCYSNRTCDSGYLCSAGDVCVACEAGTLGCDCLPNGTCGGALSCVMNGCTDGGDGPTVPKIIQCFTPCRSSFVDSTGQFRACPADGLMAGCVDGATCESGSCVPEGGAAQTCSLDVDCPDFQACIGGECLSNCDHDTDCASHERCYRHACRIPCGANNDGACPPAQSCELTDAEFGFCIPGSAPTAGLPSEVPEGEAILSTDTLSLTNVAPSKTFSVQNDAPRSIDFTLRRKRHVDPATGDLVTSGALPWVKLGALTAPSFGDEITFRVPSGGSQTVTVEVDATSPSRFTGTLALESELGEQSIELGYVSSPDGRWVGKAYYFTQFSDAGLAGYIASPSQTSADGVLNALVRRFYDFRSSELGRRNWEALLTAVLEESWDWPSTEEACNSGACYLFSSQSGVETLIEDPTSAPIPRGAIALPVAMNLHAVANGVLEGRIVSSESLHYAGDPKVTITQAATTCAPESDCRIPVQSMSSTIVLGGRYPAGDVGCDVGYEEIPTPWLVPAFERGTELDEQTGLRDRYECRDSLNPYGGADEVAALNLDLSQANPIPDGRSRARTISLVDGVLVDQEVYYLLFKESFSDTFLGSASGAPLSAYGIMVLRRANAQLEPEEYDAIAHTASNAADAPPLAAACDSVLAPYADLAVADGSLWPVDAGNAEEVTRFLLDGVPGGTPPTVPASEVHYLCHETGLFDQGPNPSTLLAECPAGSGVTYFRCPAGSVCAGDLDGMPCQSNGSCGAILDRWRAGAAGDPAPVFDLLAACADPANPYCDDRYDLEDSKVFYEPPTASPAAGVQQVFVPLATAVAEAFRYKTQFQSRTGGTLGFAPEPCIPGSSQIPYCYDAKAIENLRDRVDCLVSIATDGDLRLGLGAAATPLFEALRFHLGYASDLSGVHVATSDGFERLHAELMVMLGDDAYTAAFQSRYDLAGSTLASFEGSRFERNGIDLSGVAGYELFTLYRAVQYYGLALDRFFSLAPHLQQSLELGTDQNFVTLETVTGYLSRVLRASTQRSRAYSEIASRYHQLMRPDLAKAVVERAYTAAYLESVVIGRLIERIGIVLGPDKRPQVVHDLEQSAVAYRMALLEMREIYGDLGGDLNYFGFPPDYIPLPAPETGGPNSFELLLSRAQQSMQLAAQREDLAIQSTRSYETDQEAFQNELVGIRNSYDNQLADLCGTFRASNGQVYPATPTYAHLSEVARLYGNPCGLMGNGQIAQALGAVELQEITMREVKGSTESVLASIAIEEGRVEELCQTQLDFAEVQYAIGDATRSIEDDIRSAQNVISNLDIGIQVASTTATLMKCSVGTSSDCPTAVGAATFFGVVQAELGIARTLTEKEIRDSQARISELQAEQPRLEANLQCDQWHINSRAQVETMRLELGQLELRGLKTQKELGLALASAQSLYDRAVRLIAEQTESEQLAINLEAARNDPNVRIYRNDAIINAEWAFDGALRDAYRATKAFEYYTSQSYAKFDQLRLVRLAARGDYNLQNYLAELEDAYDAFLETFGRADRRVDVLSVRDDVLRIPRTDASGALSLAERVERFRTEIVDPKLRDGNGRIVIPFSTTIERLSPLTRNHKIDSIEIELVGSDVGDTVGRVYLRQIGTGTISRLDDADGDSYYRFPERTAVINTFFNGIRTFGPEVYRSEKMRDRPYINSGWELVFDQRGEWVNSDITLSSITDVRVYVYYTDFTAL